MKLSESLDQLKLLRGGLQPSTPVSGDYIVNKELQQEREIKKALDNSDTLIDYCMLTGIRENIIIDIIEKVYFSSETAQSHIKLQKILQEAICNENPAILSQFPSYVKQGARLDSNLRSDITRYGFPEGFRLKKTKLNDQNNGEKVKRPKHQFLSMQLQGQDRAYFVQYLVFYEDFDQYKTAYLNYLKEYTNLKKDTNKVSPLKKARIVEVSQLEQYKETFELLEKTNGYFIVIFSNLKDKSIYKWPAQAKMTIEQLSILNVIADNQNTKILSVLIDKEGKIDNIPCFRPKKLPSLYLFKGSDIVLKADSITNHFRNEVYMSMFQEQSRYNIKFKSIEQSNAKTTELNESTGPTNTSQRKKRLWHPKNLSSSSVETNNVVENIDKDVKQTTALETIHQRTSSQLQFITQPLEQMVMKDAILEVNSSAYSSEFVPSNLGNSMHTTEKVQINKVDSVNDTESIEGNMEAVHLNLNKLDSSCSIVLNNTPQTKTLDKNDIQRSTPLSKSSHRTLNKASGTAQLLESVLFNEQMQSPTMRDTIVPIKLLNESPPAFQQQETFESPYTKEVNDDLAQFNKIINIDNIRAAGRNKCSDEQNVTTNLWIPKALCFVSKYPYFDFYQEILEDIFEQFLDKQGMHCLIEQLLFNVVLQIPSPYCLLTKETKLLTINRNTQNKLHLNTKSLQDDQFQYQSNQYEGIYFNRHIKKGTIKLNYHATQNKGLPKINNNMFNTMLRKLPIEFLIRLFSGLLCEQSVLIISNDIQCMVSIVFSLVSLLYPFQFTNYIPCLLAEDDKEQQNLAMILSQGSNYIIGITGKNKDLANMMLEEDDRPKPIILDLNQRKLLHGSTHNTIQANQKQQYSDQNLISDLIDCNKNGPTLMSIHQGITKRQQQQQSCELPEDLRKQLESNLRNILKNQQTNSSKDNKLNQKLESPTSRDGSLISSLYPSSKGYKVNDNESNSTHGLQKTKNSQDVHRIPDNDIIQIRQYFLDVIIELFKNYKIFICSQNKTQQSQNVHSSLDIQSLTQPDSQIIQNTLDSSYTLFTSVHSSLTKDNNMQQNNHHTFHASPTIQPTLNHQNIFSINEFQKNNSENYKQFYASFFKNHKSKLQNQMFANLINAQIQLQNKEPKSPKKQQQMAQQTNVNLLLAVQHFDSLIESKSLSQPMHKKTDSQTGQTERGSLNKDTFLRKSTKSDQQIEVQTSTRNRNTQEFDNTFCKQSQAVESNQHLAVQTQQNNLTLNRPIGSKAVRMLQRHSRQSSISSQGRQNSDIDAESRKHQDQSRVVDEKLQYWVPEVQTLSSLGIISVEDIRDCYLGTQSLISSKSKITPQRRITSANVTFGSLTEKVSNVNPISRGNSLKSVLGQKIINDDNTGSNTSKMFPFSVLKDNSLLKYCMLPPFKKQLINDVRIIKTLEIPQIDRTHPEAKSEYDKNLEMYESPELRLKIPQNQHSCLKYQGTKIHLCWLYMWCLTFPLQPENERLQHINAAKIVLQKLSSDFMPRVPIEVFTHLLEAVYQVQDICLLNYMYDLMKRHNQGEYPLIMSAKAQHRFFVQQQLCLRSQNIKETNMLANSTRNNQSGRSFKSNASGQNSNNSPAMGSQSPSKGGSPGGITFGSSPKKAQRQQQKQREQQKRTFLDKVRSKEHDANIGSTKKNQVEEVKIRLQEECYQCNGKVDHQRLIELYNQYKSTSNVLERKIMALCIFCGREIQQPALNVVISKKDIEDPSKFQDDEMQIEMGEETAINSSTKLKEKPNTKENTRKRGSNSVRTQLELSVGFLTSEQLYYQVEQFMFQQCQFMTNFGQIRKHQKQQMFWNLIYYFNEYFLPFDFMLPIEIRY